MSGDEAPRCKYEVRLWEAVTGKNEKRMCGVVVVLMIYGGDRTRREIALHRMKRSLCREQGWVYWGSEEGVHLEVHDDGD